MKIKRVLTNFMWCIMILMYFNNTIIFAGSSSVLPSTVTEPLTDITSILLLIGAAVCIGKCIHIGILYTLSSAVEKSNAKQAMLPWIIGTFICFGAATIGKFVIELLKVPKDVLDY